MEDPSTTALDRGTIDLEAPDIKIALGPCGDAPHPYAAPANGPSARAVVGDLLSCHLVAARHPCRRRSTSREIRPRARFVESRIEISSTIEVVAAVKALAKG